jgi:hypothetical protein
MVSIDTDRSRLPIFGRATSISLNGYPTTMIKQDSRVPHVYLTPSSHSRIYDSDMYRYSSAEFKQLNNSTTQRSFASTTELILNDC